jgi:hypothetical protein
MDALFAIGLRELGGVVLLTALWGALAVVLVLLLRWVRRHPDDARGL